MLNTWTFAVAFAVPSVTEYVKSAVPAGTISARPEIVTAGSLTLVMLSCPAWVVVSFASGYTVASKPVVFTASSTSTRPAAVVTVTVESTSGAAK